MNIEQMNARGAFNLIVLYLLLRIYMHLESTSVGVLLIPHHHIIQCNLRYYLYHPILAESSDCKVRETIRNKSHINFIKF